MKQLKTFPPNDLLKKDVINPTSKQAQWRRTQMYNGRNREIIEIHLTAWIDLTAGLHAVINGVMIRQHVFIHALL